MRKGFGVVAGIGKSSEDRRDRVAHVQLQLLTNLPTVGELEGFSGVLANASIRGRRLFNRDDARPPVGVAALGNQAAETLSFRADRCVDYVMGF